VLGLGVDEPFEVGVFDQFYYEDWFGVSVLMVFLGRGVLVFVVR
jgi:hypothetical protein